jgi:pyridoxine 5-phosphate synthase
LRLHNAAREPDPVHFALQAELTGASGILAHLRINRSGLTETDIETLNRMVKTEFYLQVSPHQDLLHLVNNVRPQNLVLVGEKRDSNTPLSGLDVSLLHHEIAGLLNNIDRNHTRMLLFVEPDFDQIKAAAKLEIGGLVIHCRDLHGGRRSAVFQKRFQQLNDAVKLSTKYGLETHLSGNVPQEVLPQLALIEGVSAIHIGHPLVAKALLLGVTGAVELYRDLISSQTR